MFDERAVIPKSLPARVLKQFYIGFPGIKHITSVARSFSYWPLMDQHITDLTNRFSQCQQAAKFNTESADLMFTA